MSDHTRIRTGSFYREIPALMDKDGSTRITAMITDVGLGIWGGCQSVWPNVCRKYCMR